MLAILSKCADIADIRMLAPCILLHIFNHSMFIAVL